MKAKILSLVMLVVLVSSLALSAGATEISPRWEKNYTCTPILSFSGTKATCTASIIAKDSTDKINATMTLYRINANGSRTQVATWPSLTGTGSVDARKTYSPVVSGSTYHLVISGTVDGSTISEYHSSTCP